MQKNIVPIIIIAILFSGIGFFSGTTYQKGKMPLRGNQLQNNNIQKRPGNGQIMGEITSVNDGSVTVKTTDGSSKLILLSDKTNINQAVPATTTDLVVGQKVVIFGNTNTDNSISAQSIQLNTSLLQKSERNP
jgi:subtilase family serine protease